MKCLVTLVLAFVVVCCISDAHAAISWTGDITPFDPDHDPPITPATWTLSTTGYIGNTAYGTISVDDQSDLLSGRAYIGYDIIADIDFTSAVTVDGAGTTWTADGGLTIGHDGVGDGDGSGNEALHVTGGGAVSSLSGFIGYNSGGSGTVNVQDAGSAWTVTHLYVGRSGDGTLQISGGGAVTSRHDTQLVDGFIGYDSGSTGTVTVDGTNSAWTIDGPLSVGNFGDGTLDITNGGMVSTNDEAFYYAHGTIGRYAGSTGIVNVDGTGSTWTVDGEFFVGDSGHGTLTITNGGAVRHDTYSVGEHSYIGNASGSMGAVTVDGSGSTWTNPNGLFVGNNGDGTLDITDGGAASSSTGSIGAEIDSTGIVTVQGTNSTWTSDGNIFVGSSGNGTMNVTTGGAVTSNFGSIGDASDGLGTATVDGIGSSWAISNTLYVGNSGNGTLHVTGGGSVSSNFGDIGKQSGSTGIANIDGADSSWTMSTYLSVGNSGNGTLNVTGSGSVSCASAKIDAYNMGGSAVATVDGDGSTLTSGYAVQVGFRGSGTLNVTGGGSVSADSSGFIGRVAGSTGNVNVDGAGSTWTNNIDLYVGDAGEGTLNVTGGGTVSNNLGYIGYASDGEGFVNVEDAGSTWNNSSRLYVGYEGDGTLNVTTGGEVNSGFGYIGYNGTGTGTLNITAGGLFHSGTVEIASRAGSTGTVNVDGSGSMLIGSLIVGTRGMGTLNITGGGAVNGGGTIGSNTGSSGTATVDGVGSMWNASSGLVVGNAVSGTLNVTNGGMVTGGTGMVGVSAGSTGNVTVDGAGSSWTSSSLRIGLSGEGTLNITRGAVVTGPGSVGLNTGGTGTVTVNGTGSTWTSYHNSAGGLAVGKSGNGTLDVTGGGTVTNTIGGWIGEDSSGTGIVTVNGAGSTMTNGSNLYVGYDGDGSLSITNGGVVASSNWDFIGRNAGSTGTVTVDGAESSWSVDANLFVGHSGDGTLTITDGGLVSVSGALSIDLDEDGDSFINMATGGMLALASDEQGDDSLTQFLGLIEGTDAIRFWDDGISSWVDINAGTYGDDYTLEYLTTGDLLGHTLLSVGQAGFLGDFDGDGAWDVADINALVAEIAANLMNPDLSFDMNGDGNVTLADITDDVVGWLAVAGAATPGTMSGNPYLVGDANLDGVVDGQDFIDWNANKFTSLTEWSGGDFNADGNVDGQDFLEWNARKFTSSDRVVSVPEPVLRWVLCMVLIGSGGVRRHS